MPKSTQAAWIKTADAAQRLLLQLVTLFLALTAAWIQAFAPILLLFARVGPHAVQALLMIATFLLSREGPLFLLASNILSQYQNQSPFDINSHKGFLNNGSPFSFPVTSPTVGSPTEFSWRTPASAAPVNNFQQNQRMQAEQNQAALFQPHRPQQNHNDRVSQLTTAVLDTERTGLTLHQYADIIGGFTLQLPPSSLDAMDSIAKFVTALSEAADACSSLSANGYLKLQNVVLSGDHILTLAKNAHSDSGKSMLTLQKDSRPASLKHYITFIIQNLVEILDLADGAIIKLQQAKEQQNHLARQLRQSLSTIQWWQFVGLSSDRFTSKLQEITDQLTLAREAAKNIQSVVVNLKALISNVQVDDINLQEKASALNVALAPVRSFVNVPP